MKRVRVAQDRWNFELEGSGELISPIGGNILNDEHPAQGTLFSHFDKNDVERRFATMASIGLNCLRQAIGVNNVFSPKNGLKKEGLNNWDTFITLAEKYNIYLMPVGGYIGGNDWFDSEKLADNGKALDESCAFWDAFCSHYKGHPAIWAWDLRNELLYQTEPHMLESAKPQEQSVKAMLMDEWPSWLQIKYGSLDTLNKAYGTAYNDFSTVPGSISFIQKPYDLCAFDFRNYLNDRGYLWCKRQCDVIRTAAPGHMIVSGNNAWLSPDQDLYLANGFQNRAVHDLFDFITFHPYPALQCTSGGRGDPLDGGKPLEFWLSSCIANARMDHYGKPVVLQEFGWYGGGTSRFLCDLPYRSEEEHANYTQTLCRALMPHVNGFINWPTMDMPASLDISNHGGIFTHEGKRKALADVYENVLVPTSGKRLVRQKATTILRYSLLGIFTDRQYQDEMWEHLHQVILSGKIPDIQFI